MNYSIIVPHRDSPDLLLNAVFSIPKRTDLEILVVDNSSYDCIGPIKDKLLSHGSVLLLTSDNTKGAGYARNVALKHACGQWLLFLDADDFFLPHAFKTFDGWNRTPFDLVFFKTKGIINDSTLESRRPLFYNHLIDDYMIGKNGAEKRLRYTFTPPWSKMIKRTLVVGNTILFAEVFAAEDLLFSAKTGHYAKNIAVSEEVVYCLTEVPDSLSKTKSKDFERERFIEHLKWALFLKSLQNSGFRARMAPFIFTGARFGLKELFFRVVVLATYRINIFADVPFYLFRSLRQWKDKLKSKQGV
jgi:glycosyltransferase involved in cell wall biosynthesis